MYRIDGPQSVTTIPTPAAPGTPGFFQGGNPSAGMKATLVDADWLNAVQEEIAHVIEQATLTLNKSDRTQLWQALQNLIGGYRIILSADLDLFVAPAPTGNDNNDGLTVGTPLATISAAYKKAIGHYELNGHNIYIRLADGTHAPAACWGYPPGYWGAGGANAAPIRIVGNVSTPASCIINNSSGIPGAACVAAGYGGSVSVEGVTLTGGATSSNHLSAEYGLIWFRNCVFGPVPSSHLYAAEGGFVGPNGNYTIAGGGICHAHAVKGGVVELDGLPTTVTLTGTPAFTQGFAYASICGTISASVNSVTYAGAATGPHFNVSMNAVIQTFGGGPNFLPGNSIGVQASGGQYG